MAARSRKGQIVAMRTRDFGIHRPIVSMSMRTRVKRCTIEDLPKSLLLSVTGEIRNYTTSLFLNGHLLGSGTFISWRDHHGILTAEHVTNNPYRRDHCLNFSHDSKQAIQLMLADYSHIFSLEARTLANITLDKRGTEEWGPDLSVIVVPPGDKLNAIKARKSFWSLTVGSAEKLRTALIQKGFVAIVGHPGEQMSSENPKPDGIVLSPQMVGITVQKRYIVHEDYDYVDVESLHSDRTKAPASYKGVSGGSFWRVPIAPKSKTDPTLDHARPQLLGVPFFQSDEIGGRRFVRGHGPRSIYENLLGKLGV